MAVAFTIMRWAMVSVVVGMKEDQHMFGLRQTVLSEDFSLFWYEDRWTRGEVRPI